MSRTWLTERVNDVQNASQRFEKTTPPVDCSTFIKAFEKQLHHSLHFKNFLDGPVILPIEKGCYKAAEDFVKANGVQTTTLVDTATKQKCSEAMIFLNDHKLVMMPRKL